MKYTCRVAMGPIDQLIEIAKTAEEVGFDAIALPDSASTRRWTRRKIHLGGSRTTTSIRVGSND
jgi:alkanesulfonate monooxygenase SsuD/methylene tetrahydromethanopterin reductase-like flavin-dependent oxidoreductase (luciferase family)